MATRRSSRASEVSRRPIRGPGPGHIRQDLAGDSPNAAVQVSAANGTSFQDRDTRGGLSASIKGFAGGAPEWVRVSRVGDVLRRLLFRGRRNVDVGGQFHDPDASPRVRWADGVEHNPSVTTTAIPSTVTSQTRRADPPADVNATCKSDQRRRNNRSGSTR